MSFTVIIDTREKTPWSFNSNTIDNVVKRKLDTGDYAILGMERYLTIERKRTVEELAGNLSSARFTRELERMRDNFKHAVLILEFSMDDVLMYPIGSSIPKSRWNKLRVSKYYIIKFISDIIVKYGIQVVFAGDVDNATHMATSLMKRIYEKYKEA